MAGHMGDKIRTMMNLEIIKSDDLGVDLNPRISTLKVYPPPEREAGIIVESVDQLVEKLKNEAKVIS